MTKKTKYCVLCGCEIKGYGNNPHPLAEEGDCCEHCDQEFVIPARIMALYKGGEWPSTEAMIEDLRNTAHATGCLVRLRKAIEDVENPARDRVLKAFKEFCNATHTDYGNIKKRALE